MARHPLPPLSATYAIIVPPKAKYVASYLGEKRPLSPGGNETSLGGRCTRSCQCSPSACSGWRCQSFFYRRDYPNHVPSPGHFPLVASPIVGRVRLTRVLMDGGSGINILYADTMDCMGISRGPSPEQSTLLQDHPQDAGHASREHPACNDPSPLHSGSHFWMSKTRPIRLRRHP
jgi:hypothetical protein